MNKARHSSKKTQNTLPIKLSDLPPPSTILNHLQKLEITKGMPPAAIIYGAAGGAFFAFGLILFINRHWGDGFLTLLPAGIFTALAALFMKHQPPRR